MKKQKPFVFRAWFISALRRASYRYPPRWEADKVSKVEYGKYRCNICKEVFRKKDTQLDHVVPVVDPLVGFPKTAEGRDDWNTYVRRMLEDAQWQRVCRPCHQVKTQGENSLRKEIRKQHKKNSVDKKSAKK